MTKFNIEHIYPRLDENGEDRLMFNLNGRKVSERIGVDYEIKKDGTSDLKNLWGVDESDARAINKQLQKWVDKNKDTRFNLGDHDSKIESKEYGIRASQDDVVIWLTKEGEKELNIKGSYKINRDAIIEYESPEFGHQKFQYKFIEDNGKFKQSFYENPRHSIDQIQSRHAEMRDEASLSELVPGEKVSNIEVVDAENHLMAKFDVEVTYDDLTQKTFSASEYIDLNDGLLVDTEYEAVKNNNGGSTNLENHNLGDFDHEEVIATVNRHLSANPISKETLDTYRAEAEAAKAREEAKSERIVAH